MGGPYHLILLSLIALSGYLLTLLLVKTGAVGKLLHRRIWNTILLIAFIISGILGILLVVQLNYKLEWAFMKPLMVWHVDAGIVLCLVATFHLIWNRAFFFRIFKQLPPAQVTGKQTAFIGSAPGKISLVILALGFYSTVVQVLLIREITTVFQGNELMMGWTMGIWMFLTGAGAWLGRSGKIPDSYQVILKIMLLLTFLPPVIAAGLGMGRNLIFPPGEMVHLLWFLALILLILAPVCLLTGYSYALLVSSCGQGEKKFIRVYALESLGSIAGGFVVSFGLIRWLSVVESLLVTALLVHLTLLASRRTPAVYLSILLVSILVLLFFVFPVDLKIKSLLFPHQKIVAARETAFGNITVSENGGEYSFYENGCLLFTTGDFVISEETVHYAMLQHPRPEKVLLVSGGIPGMTGEILKFPDVKKVDLVQLNPEIMRIARLFIPIPADNRIIVTGGDGRRFIQRTKETYDVAIFAVPDPSSLQINRYYTTEFLSILKRKLNANAVVLFALSPSGNYLSPEKINLSAAIYHTLRLHFRNIAIIPGERDYFLASDASVTEQIGQLSAEKKIPASYVKPEYLDDVSISLRSQAIRQKIETVSLVNSDRKPLPVFYHSIHFMSMFVGRNFYLMVIPLVFLLLPIFLMNPVSSGMYVTGLTASAVELLLIFWFQTVFGNVYAALGVIFAIFMSGLALGSLAGKKMIITDKHQFIGQVLLALCLLFLPLIWRPGLSQLPDAGAWLLFIPVLLIPALLTGFLYVASTIRYNSNRQLSASAVYAADLWGSALGVIAVTIILVPVFGVQASCLVLAGVNGLAALFLWVTRK